jgi:ABC-type uncharacterized transport system involved in gliding motility auxiliary subunit
MTETKKKIKVKSKTRFTIEVLYQATAILAILVMINIYSHKHPVKKDLTEGNIFTLADQTKKIFSSLKEPVEAIAFFQAYHEKEGSKPIMRDLLYECEILSKGKFSYKFVDPDKKPSIAMQHNITRAKTTLFTCGKNESRIQTITEVAIVNAVVKVTRGEKKKIYLLAGHGEADFKDGSPSGFRQAGEELKTSQYELVELHLYREEKAVPSDCCVLVLASPTKNLEKNEVKMISEYIENGGKFLALVDPGIQTGLEPILEDWGINIGNNCVVDTNAVARLAGGGDVVMPVVSTYGSHAITKDFRLMTMFPYVRSVERGTGSRTAKTSSLLITTKDSWAEMSNDKAQFTPGVDKRGPISLGVAAEKSWGNGTEAKDVRIVVIGDSDFVSNRYYGRQGNGNFFQNTLNWLAKEDDLISIKARTVQNTPLQLTARDELVVLLLVLVIQPVVFLLMAFVVWLYRRSL